MLFEDVPDSGDNYAMNLSLCCVFQVMVFVHARNETVRTAMLFRDFAKNNGQVGLFLPEQGPQYGEAQKNVRLPHHFFKLWTNRWVRNRLVKKQQKQQQIVLFPHSYLHSSLLY